MFERPHHQRIAKILLAFNRDLLQQADCHFGGGTAIVLALNEYRESVDIDFLCASPEGYRFLRNTVSTDLGPLLTQPIQHLREVRTDQNKIYTFMEMDGQPIKIEIVREARVSICSEIDPALNLSVLTRADLYAQKLLANADRGLDTSVMSRDIIDMAMMIKGWGPIPTEAWDKAYAAYGQLLAKTFHQSVRMITDRDYLRKCLRKMQMDDQLLKTIPQILEEASVRLPLTASERQDREKRILALPALEQQAGAPYTFWQHAKAALRDAESPESINWIEVEEKTTTEAIGEHGQPAERVIDAICDFSPTSVSKERQAVILKKVESVADELLTQYEAEKTKANKHLPDPAT